MDAAHVVKKAPPKRGLRSLMRKYAEKLL